jgi:peptide chain release factor 1
MEEKFAWMEARYEELSVAVSQNEIIADIANWQKLLKERAKLEPAVIVWREYCKIRNEISQTEELLSVPDMASIAKQELDQLLGREEGKRQELRLLLIPKDPNDDRNVVMEVRAGAGGDEAGLFGAMLVRMYMRYAERNGFHIETVSVNETELGGIKEAVFTLCGTGAYSKMKYESGVHRIQRVPVTEAGGRIHTSTATVAVLPEVEDVEVDIRQEDLRIDTYRASGHGGQYINRTDSAVRITHIPTGLVVTCQDEKSQLKNKEQALRVLKSRLYDRYRSEKDATYAADRRAQVGTGERNEKIRTYNFPQGRVTDHRIGLSLYRVDDIVDGDLDEIIDALAVEEQAEKMKAIQ